MRLLHMIAFLLVIVGGLNWGLVGVFQFNLVHVLSAGVPAAEQAVYVLVGAAALFVLVTHKSDCTTCSKL